ncbi:MAG TPA: dihydroorotase, partial [Pirellulaceae bacterium]|nr:dihydroorotase [Pirellulaceae bacterium]
MSRLLIRRGRVIDPSQSFDRRTDLLLVDGRVAAYDAVDAEAEVIDADGCLVVPGLIDMAVELREPGCEEDETIESGTAVAIAGGYTS